LRQDEVDAEIAECLAVIKAKPARYRGCAGSPEGITPAPPQHFRSLETVRADNFGKVWPAMGERAGLVEDQRLALLNLFQHRGGF
jgi:hypothetical protein